MTKVTAYPNLDKPQSSSTIQLALIVVAPGKYLMEVRGTNGQPLQKEQWLGVAADDKQFLKFDFMAQQQAVQGQQQAAKAQAQNEQIRQEQQQADQRKKRFDDISGTYVIDQESYVDMGYPRSIYVSQNGTVISITDTFSGRRFNSDSEIKGSYIYTSKEEHCDGSQINVPTSLLITDEGEKLYLNTYYVFCEVKDSAGSAILKGLASGLSGQQATLDYKLVYHADLQQSIPYSRQ